MLYSGNNKLPMTDQQIDELVAQKERLALWVVSNCGRGGGMSGARGRMEFGIKMKKLGLDLELGGKCFKNRRKDFENRKFKFYFAFENSWNCSDYITEKFWENSLGQGAVPVVLGAAKGDYLETAPPNSFIYAHDFESPEKLADYLLYLDKNNTAYKQYFQWMKLEAKRMPNYRRTSSWCQLCRLLHGINIDNLFNPRYESHFNHIPMFNPQPSPRVVPSLEEFLYKEENVGCLDFPV